MYHQTTISTESLNTNKDIYSHAFTNMNTIYQKGDIGGEIRMSCLSRWAGSTPIFKDYENKS